MTTGSISPQLIAEIYTALVATQQHEPMLLADRCRTWPWASDRLRARFTQQLQQRLGATADTAQVITALRLILQRLFQPAFFQTPTGRLLMQQVRTQVLANRSMAPEPPALTCPDPTRSGLPTPGIAILLLDADNLKLTAVEEAWLQTLCQYPLYIKIAFANWRAGNMGGHDKRLHQRGYQMIHVPKGDNAADLKMTAVGASLFLEYPQVAEVLVCSGDQHLLHLQHTLRSRGLAVYAVSKRHDQLTVTDRDTQTVYTFSSQYGASACVQGLAVEEPASPRAALEHQILRLLQDMAPAGDYRLISAIAQRFRHQTGQTITQHLKEQKLGTRFISFLQSCPSIVLQQQGHEWLAALATPTLWPDGSESGNEPPGDRRDS